MIKDCVINKLYSLKEENYKTFTKKLCFTKYEILGVRNPLLQDLSKKLVKSNEHLDYVNIKAKYHEEIYLIISIIYYQKDYDFFKNNIEDKLSLIDNWLICDIPFYKHLVSNNKDDFYLFLLHLYQTYTNKTYYMRFVINGFKNIYANDTSKYEEIFKILSELDNRNDYDLGIYYVKMAIAWCMQVMMVDNFELVYDYINKYNFTNDTKRYLIRKIKDSYRISIENKNKINEIM